MPARRARSRQRDHRLTDESEALSLPPTKASRSVERSRFIGKKHPQVHARSLRLQRAANLNTIMGAPPLLT